ncbi:hypothetical protein [Microbacterium azadirachtae]|uniref:hypothetical protein n=1 Tax=Microbacterium azadirachtae TaxID=582680 RepID=UPI003F751494
MRDAAFDERHAIVGQFPKALGELPRGNDHLNDGVLSPRDELDPLSHVDERELTGIQLPADSVHQNLKASFDDDQSQREAFNGFRAPRDVCRPHARDPDICDAETIALHLCLKSDIRQKPPEARVLGTCVKADGGYSISCLIRVWKRLLLSDSTDAVDPQLCRRMTAGGLIPTVGDISSRILA